MYSCDLIPRNNKINSHAINPFPITSSNAKLVETSKKLEPGHAFYCIFLSALAFSAGIFFHFGFTLEILRFLDEDTR